MGNGKLANLVARQRQRPLARQRARPALAAQDHEPRPLPHVLVQDLERLLHARQAAVVGHVDDLRRLRQVHETDRRAHEALGRIVGRDDIVVADLQICLQKRAQIAVDAARLGRELARTGDDRDPAAALGQLLPDAGEHQRAVIEADIVLPLHLAQQKQQLEALSVEFGEQFRLARLAGDDDRATDAERLRARQLRTLGIRHVVGQVQIDPDAAFAGRVADHRIDTII